MLIAVLTSQMGFFDIPKGVNCVNFGSKKHKYGSEKLFENQKKLSKKSMIYDFVIIFG